RTPSREAPVPFVRRCLRRPLLTRSVLPRTQAPLFRVRPILPIPPENAPREAILAAGLHPALMGHNHSPALAVCPNGDLLAVYYTSYREYEPEVALLGVRLRRGADEWDFPDLLLDLPGTNDHAPLLWTDRGRLHLFWGNPRLRSGTYPFNWTTSPDSGATWGDLRLPRFVGRVGAHSRQPINTALRGPDGTLYLASDAVGAASVLWVSRDNGRTWSDPGGRTGGRHTTFAFLGDGRILGMGGKNSDIDGYMPAFISGDGGQSWQTTRTPFPALGNNQRPSLLRLASGRLFFATDLQHFDGRRPAGFGLAGAAVALSEDDGRSWHIRPLPGALPHERPQHPATTLGYSAARQAPDGAIHLVTSMNHPALHFEMNEAWILGSAEEISPPPQAAGPPSTVQETWPDGRLRAVLHVALGSHGRPLLHGPQRWYRVDREVEWEAEYRDGRRVGVEAAWRTGDRPEWRWERAAGGVATWTQWWESGPKRFESTWKGHRAEGPARTWDPRGRLVCEAVFAAGELVSVTYPS
ncbi:MAG: exo-alpha-sialidase, partial [Candidatus Latescibacterota bacterium]